MQRNSIEGGKPYVISMTANDAYEQDCFQAALAQSMDPNHKAIAQSMDQIFRAEEARRYASVANKSSEVSASSNTHSVVFEA